MNIVIVNKQNFHDRPPVISTLLCLSDLGHKVSLITIGVNDYWHQELEKRGIDIYILPDCKQRRNAIVKYYEFKRFRCRANKILDRHFKKSLIWLIGGNTIVSLGNTLSKRQFVLQIQELHENDRLYLKLFSKIINKAAGVILNEYNRAVIYQCVFKLNVRPTILPNKPYFVDSVNPEVLSKYMSNEIIKRLDGSKVILFQGQIVSYRDLSPYIKAAKELGGFQMVLMGNNYDGMVEKYRKIDPNLIYISRILAPDYLAVTSKAKICILTYDPRGLNNSYCAPNKIFEYGAFGKPIIGNDIPGLKPIEQFHAGFLVDESDIESIKNAYVKIEDNYQYYGEGAKALYNSVDNKATISKLLQKIQTKKYS